MKKKVLALSLLLIANLSIASSAIATPLQDATQAIDKKDYASAIIHLKNQLKEHPKDAYARFLLGDIYLITGKIKPSLKELGRAYKLAPQDNKTRFRYADVLQASGKQKDILELLKSPIENPEYESKRLSYLGNAHIILRQLADAQSLFKQANQIQKNAMAYNGLASLAILEKDFTLAEQLLQQSLALSADNTNALQLQAKLANMNNQPQKALSLYNQLIKKDPYKLSFYLERAATLAILGQNTQAKADLQMILNNVNNHPQANLIKAQILLQEHDFIGAQKAAQKVVNVTNKKNYAMFILGASHFALKNYHQAEEYLTRYLGSEPGNLKAQNILANVYLAQNQPRQSLLILDGISKEKLNKNPQLLLSLGTTYAQMGDTEKGIDLLTQAQLLAPENQEIKKRLIAVQLKSGDINDAITELEQLASQQNDARQTNYLLIISYIKQKQLDKADNKIKQLLKEDGNNVQLLNLSALVEQLRGNTNKASSQYKSILLKDTNNIPAHMALARISASKENWSEAEHHFKKVLQVNPKIIKASIGLAALADKNKQPERAEQYLLDALENTKGNITSQLTIAGLLSLWYEDKKQLKKLLTLAEQLQKNNSKNDSKNQAIRAFLARAQLLNKQYERAERTLKSIISLDENNIKHRILLAKIISRNNARTADALKILTEAQAIAPENSLIYALKASLLTQNKQYEQAITIAHKLQEKFPEQSTGKLLEADIKRNQNKYQEALSIYQSVYKETPTEKVFAAIIDMLMALKQKDKAVTLLTEQAAHFPDDIASLFKLASLHQEKKQRKQASHYYQLILAKEPNHVLSLNNLAWIKIEQNKKEALNLAKKAYQYAPKSVAIMDTYGYFLALNKQYSQALSLLKQAILLAPKDNDIQYHLAFTYYEMANKKKAQDILHTLVNTEATFFEKDKALKLYKKINAQ